MGDIKKDSTNPFFKSKYAALDSILPAIKSSLADAGLTFVQIPTHLMSSADKTYVPALRTILIDVESGETIEDTTPLILAKQDSQGHGAAITYMRRFALVAVLGLNTEEDDDGNAASQPRSTQRATGPASSNDVPDIDINSSRV